MIACLLIPGFELRAALRERPALALRPAALGPAAGEEPLLGPVTAAAEAAGVQPGMRLGEALSLCPDLALIEQDPATAEHEWEQLLKRLEDSGFAGEAAAVRCGYCEQRGKVRARKVANELVETFEFPEAVANELTLRRALGALLDRLLARPERGDRAVRKLALSAKLVGGGSWRRTVTLRDATADRDRLRVALGSKLAELPAPVTRLGLELVELAQTVRRQLELVQPEGLELRAHLSEGLKQVRAGAGSRAVGSVLEVAPWSRIPEQRALLVPRDDW